MASKKQIEDNKTHGKSGNGQICAILSYLLIGIIWYFVDKNIQKEAFVKFHVKQGLVLLVFSIIWATVLSVLFGMFLYTWFAQIWMLISLLHYVPLILAIVGIINAVNHKQSELPIIGHFAKKLTF